MKPYYSLICVLLILSFTVCQSQAFSKPSPALIFQGVTQRQDSDSLIADKYYQEALELFESGLYENAILYLKKAAECYEGIEMWPEYVDAYTSIGLNFAYMDEFDSSEIYLNAAMDVGLQRLDKNSIALSDLYIVLGGMFATIGNYSKALESYEKALESKIIIYGANHPETGLVRHYMAGIFGIQGNFLKARELQEQALKLFKESYGNEHSLVADAYDELGSAWRYLGDLNKGIEYHEKALEIRLLVLGSEDIDMAYGYHHLGGLWYERNEFTKALSYYKKGLEINLLHNGESHSTTASFNDIIGLAYIERGNFKLAQEYLEKALKIRQAIFGSEHPETAKSFHGLANLWFNKKDFDKSVFYYAKALGIRESIYGAEHPIIASGYHNMGLALEEKGALEKAEEYFKKALSIAQQTQSIESTSIYQSTLGNLYMKRGDWKVALSHYQAALSAASTDFDPKDLLSNPALADILLPYQALSALQMKGLVLKKAYTQEKDTTSGYGFLKEALNSTYLAIRLMDKIQAGYQETASLQLFSNSNVDTYVNGIEIAQTLFEATGQRKYLSMAFEIAERSRAFSLSQNIKKQNNYALPDSLLVLERELKIEIRFLEEDIVEMTSQKDTEDKSLVEGLKNRLFLSKRNLERLIKSFEEDYPAYYELKYQKDLINVTQLQKALPQNTGLVEYVWADSLLYVFTISSQYEGLKVIPLSEKFKDEIERFIAFNGDHQNALRKGNSKAQIQGYAALSFNIFDRVLSSQLDSLGHEIKSLIIVPDGPLARLPFATLTVRRQGFDDDVVKAKFRDLGYLVKEMSIRYAFSASLLHSFNHQPNPDRKVQGNFIGFAPRYLGKGAKSESSALRKAFADDEGILSPLRFNETEVKDIAQIVGGEVFLGEEATEMAFKNNARAYSIVHIAAHGLVNDSLPDYSGIAFSTESTADTINDGFLQSYELYNMRLQADLVVLSACETAVGQWQNGEGLISIARAFKYAGSRNILASQWAIDDESTAKLMQLFCLKLKSGLQKDVALREAQLEFIETSVYSHPSFWGAYALWGDSEPIKWKKSPDKNVSIYLSLILLVTGFSFFFFKRKKRRKNQTL